MKVPLGFPRSSLAMLALSFSLVRVHSSRPPRKEKMAFLESQKPLYPATIMSHSWHVQFSSDAGLLTCTFEERKKIMYTRTTFFENVCVYEF